MPEYSSAWKMVYKTYPPLLRVLEKIGIHSGRQAFLLGALNKQYTVDDLRRHLVERGFEDAVLAWKDSGEVLSMRKVNEHIFQWHIRLHGDGEIRGHYECSSEGNPIGHIFGKVFRPETEFFTALLGEYLIQV
jgi:hypothetical protein